MSAEDVENPPPASNEKPEFIPGYATLEDFTKDGFQVLKEAIRHSSALPMDGDRRFYNTALDTFSSLMSQQESNVLRLINGILRTNEIDSNIRNKVLDDKTELVVEANDVILEKVATNIDEMMGIRRTVPQQAVLQTVSAQLPINGSWNRAESARFSIDQINKTPSSVAGPHQQQQTSAANCIRLITAQNIARPQKFFKDKPDNRSSYPWQPRITYKPNNSKPLAIFLEEEEEQSANPGEESYVRQEFSHPYQFELDRFGPIPEQLVRVPEPKFPRSMEETPLVEIDRPEQLDELVESLRGCKEFAVDLEHHSYRSFMGFTCLMQISTEDKDYLIDTLSLRDKLHVLNEVFTKPTIVKIFHGADRDIEWLQRDLSLYVVNMFDTHQACKLLEYSQRSLAYLLQRFCQVTPDKQFQLADWRIRPLPEEFKRYAREDTHYLIYIYQMLKNDLLDKSTSGPEENTRDNLLRAVIQESTELCKKRYFKPVLTEDSHLNLCRRFKKAFDNRQMYALRELYAWRDRLAREEDESLGYVMPNHMLLKIAEALPKEMQGVLACCNPVPPLVRAHVLALHQIVLRAREQSLEKPIFKEDARARGATALEFSSAKINTDSPLYCPHDLSKSNARMENLVGDDLPTLLNGKLSNKSWILRCIGGENSENQRALLDIEKSVSEWRVFGSSDGSDNEEEERRNIKKVHGINYLSPYQRYLRTKPFVQAEEEKSAAAAKQNEEEEEENRETKIKTNVENQKNRQQKIVHNKKEPEDDGEIESDGDNDAQDVDTLEVSDDGRTDEDRIASVREHFLNLSRETIGPTTKSRHQHHHQHQQQKKFRNSLSLKEMGAPSRKRKRQEELMDESGEIVLDDSYYEPASSAATSSSFVRNPLNQGGGGGDREVVLSFDDGDLGTPLPNLNSNIKRRFQGNNTNNQNSKRRKLGGGGHINNNDQSDINPDDPANTRNNANRRRKRGNVAMTPRRKQFQSSQQPTTKELRWAQHQQSMREHKCKTPFWLKEQQYELAHPGRGKRPNTNNSTPGDAGSPKKRAQQNQQSNQPTPGPNKNINNNNNNNKKQQQQQQQQQQQKKQNKNKQNYHLQQQKQGKQQGFSNNNNQRQQHQQQQDNFTPYDYSSVDFRQFQGGAGNSGSGATNQRGRGGRGNHNKQANRAQNWKRMGNKGAQSATFHNNAQRGGKKGGRPS